MKTVDILFDEHGLPYKLIKCNKSLVKVKYIKINCSHCNNEYYLRKYSYEKRIDKINCCSISCSKKYRYNIKNNILKHKNTPEFYYLIGLIATDGLIRYPSNNYNNYTTSIEMSITNKNLLKSIQDIFNGKLNITHNKNAVKWSCHNSDFVLYLKNNVGLTSKKSLSLNINLNWWNSLSKPEQNAFLRGCYDGDGSITKNNNQKRKFISIELVTCSKHFFEFIFNIFKNRGYDPKKTLYKPKTLNRNISYKICFYGKNAITPLKEIFELPLKTQILEKTNRFKEFIKTYS